MRSPRPGLLFVIVSALLLSPALAAAQQTCWPALTTEDSAFAGLPEWNYAPKYVTVQPCGYRMAYVDEGPRTGKVVLLVHGNPTWGFYYRKAIPRLVQAGYRVVVPDLVGFGRSDKIANDISTYANHEAWLTNFIHALGLRDINLFVHDWGGLLGLRIVAFDPGRFSKVIASNTSLPGGEGEPPILFVLWQYASQVVPFSLVMEDQTLVELPPEVERAYDAPYPSYWLSLAPRDLPWEVPLDPASPEAARNRAAFEALRGFTKPFVTAYSEPDDITGGWDVRFQSAIPGAWGQPHQVYPGTRHYIGEDVPEQLIQLMLTVYGR